MLSFARILMILGVVLLLGGALLYLAARSGFSLGQMPGNIKIQGTNFTCVFALGASIVLSILLTVILNLVVRFLNK
jgi:Protein of unknown function (DUF2905)